MGKYFTSEYKRILDVLSSSGSNLSGSANAVADSQKSIGSNLKSSISNFLSLSTWDGSAKQALTVVWEGVSQAMAIASDLVANNLVKAADLAVPTLRDLLKTIKEKEEKLIAMEAELVRLENAQSMAYTAYINTPDTISDTDSYGNKTKKTNPDKATAKTAWDTASASVDKQKADIRDMETALTGHTNEAASIIGQIKGLNGGGSTSMDSIMGVANPISSSNFSTLSQADFDVSLLLGENNLIKKDGNYYYISKSLQNNNVLSFGNIGIVKIDLEKIQKTLAKSGNANWQQDYAMLLDGLNGQMNGTTKGAIWKVGYHAKTSANVALIMNQILEDSYAASGCKNRTDYANVASTVLASNPVLALSYAAFFDGKKIDCHGLTRWAYQQADIKTGINYKTVGNHLAVKTLAGSKFAQNITTNMLLRQGGLLAKSSGQGHVMMVMGSYKSGGETMVVISESSGSKGPSIREYPLSHFKKWSYKYISPEDASIKV